MKKEKMKQLEFDWGPDFEKKINRDFSIDSFKKKQRVDRNNSYTYTEYVKKKLTNIR